MSTPLHPDTENATIFVYDGFEGGLGISENLYQNVEPSSVLIIANAKMAVPHVSTPQNVETKTNP